MKIKTYFDKSNLIRVKWMFRKRNTFAGIPVETWEAWKTA